MDSVHSPYDCLCVARRWAGGKASVSRVAPKIGQPWPRTSLEMVRRPRHNLLPWDLPTNRFAKPLRFRAGDEFASAPPAWTKQTPPSNPKTLRPAFATSSPAARATSHGT